MTGGNLNALRPNPTHRVISCVLQEPLSKLRLPQCMWTLRHGKSKKQ